MIPRWRDSLALLIFPSAWGNFCGKNFPAAEIIADPLFLIRSRGGEACRDFGGHFSLYTPGTCCYKPQKIVIPVRLDRITVIVRRGGQGSMSVARKLGILVFFGVPVIIGGGIVYAIFNDLAAIFIYQAILLLFAGAFIAR
jgi:hypothetical protein